MKKLVKVLSQRIMITIVVLLILAVVTIQEIKGDGIITYAKTATEKWKMGQIKDEAELIKGDAYTEYRLQNRTLGQTELIQEINEHFEGSTISGTSVITKDGKYKILVDENLNITVVKNEEKQLAKGDVKVTHEVYDLPNGNYEIEVNLEVVGIPVFNENELLYSFFEEKVLPGKSTEELIIMAGQILMGQTLEAEQVYDAMYKSEFGVDYETFMANKDALVQDKYNVPKADTAIKMLILENKAGENYSNILEYGMMVQRSKQILPEFIGKSETEETASTVEGWFNNQYEFEDIINQSLVESFGEGVDLDMAVAQLNIWTGLSEENYIFNREDGIILISALVYKDNNPIIIEYPDGTKSGIDWFSTAGEFYHTVLEPGSYILKITGPNGNTVEEVVKVGASIELNKDEITQVGETTLTATLINIDESKLVWTSSDDNIASVEGSGATVKVIAKSAGEATITATFEGNTATCVVKIEGNIILDKTNITKEITTLEPITETLTVTLVNIAEELKWETSDSNIVEISGEGNTRTITIKPVEGTATITVSYGNVKAQCTVKVIDKINYAEVIVPVIEKTGNFANNANISEVRKGNIPIPTGYTYVKGAVNGGAVIKDGSGNEWVWIPATVSEISEVVNGKNVGKLYAFSSTGATAKDYPTTSNSGGREPDIVSGYDSSNSSIVLETEKYDTFLEQLQAEFDNMIESVRLYGGYYIGRYEAGGTISSPVLKQGATVITNSSDTSNWYYMYNSAKKLAANSSVTTGMIWGCQWDNTLRWLVSSGNRTWEELVDSKTWGNYDNSSGDADITGHGSPQEAGYSEYWKAGNIYDLAGNYYDWTLEANNTLYRVFRGGYCDLGSDVYPASNRNNRFYPTDAYGNGTFRPTLIIE